MTSEELEKLLGRPGVAIVTHKPALARPVPAACRHCGKEKKLIGPRCECDEDSPAPVVKAPPSPVSVAAPAKPAKGRLRQNTTGMNKTETAFLAELKRTLPDLKIYVQAITLKIANGCRYTPDFVLCSDDGKFFAYETKGFMRDDAAVKIKVAAAMYPAITFTLVSRKGGVWIYQKMLP